MFIVFCMHSVSVLVSWFNIRSAIKNSPELTMVAPPIVLILMIFVPLVNVIASLIICAVSYDYDDDSSIRKFFFLEKRKEKSGEDV